MGKKPHTSHVLVVPYPSQGHINPMSQFSKRLASKGLKTTLAITNFIFNTSNPKSPTGSVNFETISDGFDEGGISQASSIQEYLIQLEEAGSKTLAQLITRYKNSENPIDCVIYDAFLPWALDVAKQFDLAGAPFFTQPCAVNFIYYYVHHGLLKLPVSSTPISLPGMPLLELRDMPSFIYVSGSYPDYFESVMNQLSNAHKADWIFVNTVYKFEAEVVDAMSKVCPLFTIGPTIPSFYLDNQAENDKDYGFNLFEVDSSTDWLNDKPKGSVVYVSFGSRSCLSNNQMEELAMGLKESSYYFFWAVRASEESKLPKGFIEDNANKGLIVKWSNQLEVLSNEAIGCFLTHCGWNSTLEALCLGVPMVGMPQWTDQTTNAKFVEDVWEVGKRVEVYDSGIVSKEEIKCCIREVMEGERASEMKSNALKWKEFALEAISEGGTTDKHIDEFISNLVSS